MLIANCNVINDYMVRSKPILNLSKRNLFPFSTLHVSPTPRGQWGFSAKLGLYYVQAVSRFPCGDDVDGESKSRTLSANANR